MGGFSFDTTFTNSKFCCRSNGANSIQVKRQNFCQIWRKIDNFYKKKFFSLFLIFWPKYLAQVGNFQCQEDLILWNFLYDNCEKKCQLISAVCLHFSKKFLKDFKFCYHWDNFIMKSWLRRIFKFMKFSSKFFGGVAQNFLYENFVNLKIQYNQQFIMKFSHCYQN